MHNWNFVAFSSGKQQIQTEHRVMETDGCWGAWNVLVVRFLSLFCALEQAAQASKNGPRKRFDDLSSLIYLLPDNTSYE